MLTLLLLAPPIGVMLGYVLTALLIAHYTWHWIFYLQAATSLVLGLVVIGFVKMRYFDIEAQGLRNHLQKTFGTASSRHREDTAEIRYMRLESLSALSSVRLL